MPSLPPVSSVVRPLIKTGPLNVKSGVITSAVVRQTLRITTRHTATDVLMVRDLASLSATRRRHLAQQLVAETTTPIWVRAVQAQSRARLVIDIKPHTDITVEFNHSFAQSNPIFFWHIGQGSRVTVVERHQASQTSTSLSTLIELDRQATLNYCVIEQDLPPGQLLYSCRLAGAATAHFDWCASMGSDADRTIVINPAGRNSASEIVAGIVVHGRSQSFIRLINHHHEPETTGTVHTKVIGTDLARCQLEGWIMIGRLARQTSSYLWQDAVLASPQATVKTEPNLEILNHDVQASHSATVGPLDPAALFYLTTRGLDPRAARALLLKAFFQSLLSHITNDTIRPVAQKTLYQFATAASALLEV